MKLNHVNTGILCIIVFVLLSFSFGHAAVSSQWRGFNRDGIYQETGLLKAWPADGPKQLWSTDGLGRGFSQPAVTNDRVFVTGEISGTGYLFAFDHTGKQIYKKAYGPEWTKSFPGVRTTPTVVDDQLYIVSAQGAVVCMKASDGSVLWSVDMVKTFGAQQPQWAFCESVLIDGEHAICTPGGSKVTLAALDRNTGKTIWTCNGNGDKPSYCSPILITRGGQRIIITMTQKSIIAVNADTGNLLWNQTHQTDWDVNPNSITYKDGMAYAVSGYGTGGQMLKLSADGSKIEQVWKSGDLDSQIGATILMNGYIYGSGMNNRGWKCVDWNTGKTLYTSDALGKGCVVAAEGMLYCYTEKGEVALAKPSPASFDVVSSFKIKQGSEQHWAHPVIKAGRMYIRHGNALMVFDVKK
ncbi:PQQ-binding-like beta-propeller repeat protein [candidate division KSB1 bacterium]|nr:PQQ-binding-like beta-propeller repeat protein [candidate division KSB1 bacterium]